MPFYRRAGAAVDSLNELPVGLLLPVAPFLAAEAPLNDWTCERPPPFEALC